MAILTTKYDVGDVVWYADTVDTKRQHPCPDCLGARKWAVTSPAGTDYTVACPRCASQYLSNSDLSLNYEQAIPLVPQLTIGSVEFERGGPRYMAIETGVGSGRIYSETDLFATEEAAQFSAQVKADQINANAEGYIAKRYDRSLVFCDYQIDAAREKSAEARAERMANKIRWFLGDLDTCETIAEVKEEIEKFNEDATI